MKNDNDNIIDHPNDIVCEGGVVTFREGGHHSREAHMDDMIVDEYNDGELSARCCELYISELN